MNSNCQTIKLSSQDPDHRDGSQLVLQQGRTGVAARLRSNTALAALAILVTLATLGMMLAFYQVVRGAVAQGESLQQVRNQQSAAFWRCNGVRGSIERDNCLRQADPKDSAGGAQ